MMSEYSVVRTGKNEVTSRSLGCLATAPPAEDCWPKTGERTGLPPDTYEAKIIQKKYDDFVSNYILHGVQDGLGTF